MRDAKRDRSRGGPLRDIGRKRIQVFDCLGQPQDIHVAERLATGRSFLPFQELTHSLIRPCETPWPGPSEATAFRIAGDLPLVQVEVLLNCLKEPPAPPGTPSQFRFLSTGSMRTLTVVDDMPL
jgi:hypothetical protein